MYFHVIENCQRNGIKGYRLVKTYRQYPALMKWLLKTGAPIWVVESKLEYIQLPYRHSPQQVMTYGGFTASYWNTGGWGSATMPVLPWHEGR